MKLRVGFVSNSSSASFMVPLSKITEDELTLILKFPYWGMTLEKTCVYGFTVIDNGELAQYLKKNKMSHLMAYIEGDE